jgi:nitroimidazol reductase NimA-like FMN-containing flavoprotein (pyridoxamine 5'-phosphate oxidase superfamily)
MDAEGLAESDELLEHLDAAACARLLAATTFGRLALVEAGKPVIVVLNHVLEGSDVLFRTGEAALIARLTDGRAVAAAYEVDSAFPVGESGWSVIATGQLARESDPAVAAAAVDRIRAWAHGDREVVLRLRVEELTGRRVGAL